jgi:protein TonB
LDYAQQQRQPGKHAVGIGIVLALHLVLGWALVNGLAQRLVEVIKSPLETKIIEEVKPPPPPPPENLPPPPKFAPPPPSFVPPPEVNVNPPPMVQQTITTTQVAPPPAPVTVVAAPAVIAAPAPPSPRYSPRAVISNLQGCAPKSDEYPAAAVRAEATGTSKVRINIDAEGRLQSVDIVKSAGASREHKMLDRLLASSLGSRCKFEPARDEAGKPVAGYVEAEYVWKLD